jgi:alcohol dehydrogenase
MHALLYADGLQWRSDYPAPQCRDRWVTMDVLLAGICRTDLEITQGYMAFRGVLGHEFVGRIRTCDDPEWIGKRVVGEINAACGQCKTCCQGLGRHCPHRSVLGILNLDGCLAQQCALPKANVLEVPSALSDEEAAFIEPLSAACEILEQIVFHGQERCVVLGDGKLGILCAWVLTTTGAEVTLVGHHPDKLALAEWRHLRIASRLEDAPSQADVVIEATGSAQGLMDAIGLCRPRGTIVLKSTLAASSPLNLAPVVIQELTVLGSRCGPFARGLREMERHHFPVSRLISARYPLPDALEAFAHASRPGVLKVLLEPQ